MSQDPPTSKQQQQIIVSSSNSLGKAPDSRQDQEPVSGFFSSPTMQGHMNVEPGYDSPKPRSYKILQEKDLETELKHLLSSNGMDIEAKAMPQPIQSLNIQIDQKLESTHKKLNIFKNEQIYFEQEPWQLLNPQILKMDERRCFQPQFLGSQKQLQTEECQRKYKSKKIIMYQPDSEPIKDDLEDLLARLNPHPQNDPFFGQYKLEDNNFFNTQREQIEYHSSNKFDSKKELEVASITPQKKIKRNISDEQHREGTDRQELKNEIKTQSRTWRYNKQKSKKRTHSPYSISLEKKRIKNVDHDYQNRKIIRQMGSIVNSLENSIKIINFRKINGDVQYLWKLGNFKKWLNIEDAIEHAFEVYYRQLMGYKKTVKKYIGFDNYQSLKQIKKLETPVKNSTPQVKKLQASTKKNHRDTELQDSPNYQRQLKIVFNDVLIKKYVSFEKLKEYKTKINTDKIIEIESDIELSNSENESQYIPNTGELKNFLNDVIEQSNQKIKRKFTPKQASDKPNKQGIKKEEEQIKAGIKMSLPHKKPMSTKIINDLSEFHNGVDYVNKVDEIVGKLSKQHTKLSCLQGGLGLRSSHRIEELTREQYIRDIIEAQNPSDPELMEINSKSCDFQYPNELIEQIEFPKIQGCKYE